MLEYIMLYVETEFWEWNIGSFSLADVCLLFEAECKASDPGSWRLKQEFQ